ncbi:Ribosomal protein S24e [Methanothermus fervidus DSM 2088]|uniref:Small ribosomal subunit protein eS24 n=1 Tax=Methanothermus fervidus (strain ATCC 43054 / DSM 2088 / JCM 10308 / V24 S) TaxID=523846 RepID=E3GY57_METFV|nr:30S ribosomal protein S24e [Methanothermus fervidus]ADP77239.1 Ribosomal protein S24e [Methanothermus fervidus DSM 2088]
MEINITEEKRNELLKRKEIKFECLHSGEPTPKRVDVRDKLSSILDVNKELIVIDTLEPRYGEGRCVGYAKIYDSKESLEEIEQEHIIRKNKIGESKAKEGE